ncbi:hypothetical protein D9M70_147720 [compost metagenome]
MTRTAAAAEAFGNQRDIDAGLAVHAVRVHFFHVRVEQEVAASGYQLLLVGHQGAGVGGQVFAGPELQRVDEDTGDHEIGALAGFLYQGDVPGVEVAHGGHEADALAFAARAGDGCAQFADGLDGDHAENPCSAAGKVTSFTALT